MRGFGVLIFIAGCGFQADRPEGAPLSLALGTDRTCALWADDDVRCWGRRAPGGEETIDLVPRRIDKLTNVREVAVGSYDCAIHFDGTVSCWGPAPSSWTGLFGVKQLTLRSDRGCAALEDDSLACGALFAPALRDPDLSGVTGVTLGQRFSCVSFLDGNVRCWGDNSLGELGDGSGVDQVDPVPVVLGEPVLSVTAGDSHACALTRSRRVYCWGSNRQGKLGVGSSQLFEPTPERVALDGVEELGAGNQHTCARTSDGSVSCWGSNAYGELGDGTGERAALPVRVVGLPTAQQLRVRGSHACALADGAVYCWGSNDFGELGDGTKEARLQPVQTRF